MNLRVEPVLKLLTCLLIFFTAILLYVAKYMDSDGQTFQVISGLLMGVAGALLGWIKPPAPGSVEPLPGTSRQVVTTEKAVGIPPPSSTTVPSSIIITDSGAKMTESSAESTNPKVESTQSKTDSKLGDRTSE